MGRGGLCWQGFSASFCSAFCPASTVFYHRPPRFPTCKTPARRPQPGWGRKTHGEELGTGSPGATPRCTTLPPHSGTGDLGGFSAWRGFQALMPRFKCYFRQVLPPSSPACNRTRFFSSYCSVAEADEKLRCFNLEAWFLYSRCSLMAFITIIYYTLCNKLIRPHYQERSKIGYFNMRRMNTCGEIFRKAKEMHKIAKGAPPSATIYK